MFIVQDFELLPSFSRVSSPEGPDRSQSYQPTGHRGPGGFSLASLGQRGRTGCISDTFPGALGSLLTLFHGLYYPSSLFSNAPPHGPLFCFYLLTAQSQQPESSLPKMLSGSSQSFWFTYCAVKVGKEGLFQIPIGWGASTDRIQGTHSLGLSSLGRKPCLAFYLLFTHFFILVF